MINPSQHEASEGLKRTLFFNAMSSRWNEVIETYKMNPEAHTAKLDRSGDTALNMAIWSGEEAVVEELVAVVRETDGALEMRNELGYTPLHLAAYLGNAEMCRSIAGCDSKLMGLRNGDNETPFFLAIRYGRKEAFYAMHRICRPGEGYDYCRGKDGETILHSAISREYFDLAFYILNHYQMLRNAITEQGFSPLHILANKPSIFRSGSQIRGLDKLIYHCIPVNKLQLENIEAKPDQYLRYEENTAKYPENYHTCALIFNLLRKVPRILVKDSSESEDAERFQYVEAQKANRLHYSKVPASYPQNYKTFFDIAKLISKVMLVMLGCGWEKLEKMREKKEKHIWSIQIMQKSLEYDAWLNFEYEANGMNPAGGIYELTNRIPVPTNPPIIVDEDDDEDRPEALVSSTDQNKAEEDESEMGKKETPILTAARNGITEMVEWIRRVHPTAIFDKNEDEKNIFLLAVENRHLHLCNFLLKSNFGLISIFKIDKDGNTALHLVARLGEDRPWLTPGLILQMQWEIKWYEFVKKSMPPSFFQIYNIEKKTAAQIFSETHNDLVGKDSKRLSSTSNSCSVVAALVAAVAFTASTTIPGGVKSDDTGAPALENDAAFTLFAISSLVALGFSVTAVVMFLAILTARHKENEFLWNLPMKLLVGLTSLLISIASMLLCFCAGHFLVLKDKFEYASLPLYVVTCLPLTFFAVLQFPQYIDLVIATISKAPQRFPSTDDVVQPRN